MNGNGGMVSSKRVAREAAKTVMSGPVSGVIGAAYTGRAAGIPDLIIYDMGGTSTDVALIRDAELAVSTEIEVEYGMPIHVPMVDARTVGAGGGSIARINAAGLLEVGPESAGAVPGPICYGRGGTEPTISDANLLLGRLDPGKLKSVEGGVSIDDVRAVFEEKIAKPLELDATGAAEAVIRMANTKMAGAIRMVSVSLGADPRDFALFAFGGAGPLHATALAREIGVPTVLVPCRPGIANAIGCVVADLRYDFVNTLNRPLDAVDGDELLLSEESVEITEICHIHSVDMQFVGQSHLLRMPLATPTPDRATLRRQFEEVYFRRFRVELAEIRANLVNVNTSVIGARPALDLSTLIDPAGRKGSIEDARTAVRPIHFAGEWHETPIYWRDHLPAEFRIEGPAVIEQMDATVLIEPGDVAEGDGAGNILVAVGGEK